MECEKMRKLTLKEVVTRSNKSGWYVEDVLYKTDCDYIMSYSEFLEHNSFRNSEESYGLYLESMPVVYVKSGV